MKNNTKTKYLIQVLVFAFVFALVSVPVYASEITAENVVKFVNQARKDKGLDSLAENDKLIKAAQDKLNDMIKNDYFAHTSPKGVTPWHWFEKNSYDYRYAGENLALSFKTAEEQHNAWMNSATHRKNILNPNYREIGVAVGAEKVDGEISIITVQEFGAIAGVYQTSEDNSAGGENILIKEGEKNIPQILLDKETALNSLEKNRVQAGSAESNVALINIISAIFTFVLMLTMTLVPAVFLAKALDEIMIARKIEETNNPIS